MVKKFFGIVALIVLVTLIVSISGCMGSAKPDPALAGTWILTPGPTTGDTNGKIIFYPDGKATSISTVTLDGSVKTYTYDCNYSTSGNSITMSCPGTYPPTNEASYIIEGTKLTMTSKTAPENGTIVLHREN